MSADRGDDNSAVRDVAEWGHQGKLSRGFEVVVTTAIFAAVGWLIDRWLGTTPIFTLVLGIFCFGYLIWSTVREYIAEMEAFDAALPSRQAASLSDQAGPTS